MKGAYRVIFLLKARPKLEILKMQVKLILVTIFQPMALLTSPPVPLSNLERGNRGQGVKGVRWREPMALVV